MPINRFRSEIKEGDKVNVFFGASDLLSNCEVLHIPCAVGDSWRLRKENGKLFYVQLFETIELLNKGEIDHDHNTNN